MLSVLSAICVFVVSTAAQKTGVCDQTRECMRYSFQPGERALCLGYYGCKAAEFHVDDKVICSGMKACFRAKYAGDQALIMCNGLSACERARSITGASTGLVATEKIVCNGLKACNAVVGGLNAPRVQCDGDLTCTNIVSKTAVLQYGLNINGDSEVYCNGHGACKQAQIRSNDLVYCDGDGGCLETRIIAPTISCQGKRVCKDSFLSGQTIMAYGFFGAANTTVYPQDLTQHFTVKAYGFNSLVLATVETRGAPATLEAYGYRAMAGSTFYCGPNSDCNVICKSNACRGLRVDYAKNANLRMDPPECMVDSPPRKIRGVHCPQVCKAGVCLTSLTEQEIADQAQFVYEMAEMDMVFDREFNAYIEEKLSVYDNLPNYDDDEDDELDEEFSLNHEADVAIRSVMQSVTVSKLLWSNVVTGLVVFGVSGSAFYCYLRMKGKSENYKLLPY
eukprot:CAMPEP_0197072006 /NCGR_PEP_ID=MMETSP1384-20130603/209878_1 /TAXON_ID=29189 /ORGANISM="Ammonia sp." /LENGTH=448 /DNA_ID=CAMNT_0042510819 /DNA_START=101 /DNA_END=1447 /DNA_ORIENTATION=+